MEEKSKTDPPEKQRKRSEKFFEKRKVVRLTPVTDFIFWFFFNFAVRYVRANVDFDHGTKVNFSPDTR